MLALAIFGVIAIYSATYMREDPVAAEFWRKQANWVVVGFFAFMFASLIDYHWIRWGALPMYLAGLFFLILTKFIGSKVYGARSWLHFGPDQFSAGAARGRGRDHGAGALSEPVPPDASDAAASGVRRDRWRAVSSDFDAARSWGMHHLGCQFCWRCFLSAVSRCAI